jgi:predicted PurR-regulated permease PerM
MNANAPNRPDLTRTLLIVLVTGLLIVGSFWILRPFLAPLLWAAMIVIATWPLMQRVQQWLFGKRALAVTVMSLAFLLLFAIPIGYGVSALVEYLPAVVDRVKDMGQLTIPPPPDWVGRLPWIGERIESEWRRFLEQGPGPLLQQVLPYLKAVGAWLIGEAGGLGVFVVQLFVTLLLTAILYTTGDSAAHLVRRFARRLGGERGERTVELAAASVRAVALGIIVTALVQSVMAGAGLAIAGVPYAQMLTGLTFVLCIAQLGPGFVLLPAVAWLYWTDSTVAATALLVWTAVTIGVDNVLRPVLIKRGDDLPLMLIMAGVIGGLLAFGVIGLFVGPVILAVSFRLLEAWIDEGLGEDHDAASVQPSATGNGDRT